MRENILDEKTQAEIAVYAVWLPMLGGEDRSDWDGGPLIERRVSHFWDGERLLGRRLADDGAGDLGGPGEVVWDAYLLFDGAARWGEKAPEAVAAGSPIIAETGTLGEEAAKLLAP